MDAASDCTSSGPCPKTGRISGLSQLFFIKLFCQGKAAAQQRGRGAVMHQAAAEDDQDLPDRVRSALRGDALGDDSPGEHAFEIQVKGCKKVDEKIPEKELLSGGGDHAVGLIKQHFPADEQHGQDHPQHVDNAQPFMPDQRNV